MSTGSWTRLVLDLLRIRDPHGVSLPARPGEFGVGDLFSFPLQSVKSLEVLGDGRLLIANDNNYPSSDGRWCAWSESGYEPVEASTFSGTSISRFRILPVGPLGSSSTNQTLRGYL
jgi:hypothetical protein